MRKVIYLVGMIALIAAIMVIPASAKMIYVDDDFTDDPPNHKWDTIQEGIDDASDGDTVFVYSGTYSGTFNVNTPNLTITGEGADVVTWNGGGSNSVRIGMDNNAARSIVEGFTVINSPYGVVMDGAPNSIIRNCVFDGLTHDETGILFISSADNSTFENNVVTNAAGGFYAMAVEASSCTIANNTFIDNTGAGLSLEGGSENDVVTRNNFTSNAYAGIELYNAGSGNKIYLNNFIDNGVTATTTETTVPAVTYWNSTEPIEYVCPSDGNTYTNYLGNYWSDYTTKYPGASEDGCGIWDTAYEVPDGLGEDHHPLMEPFENYLMGEAPLTYPFSVTDEEIVNALNYLRGAQGDDGNIGGFGTSAWVAMAIAAGGEDPHTWKTADGNPSIVDYLRDNSNLLDPDKATDWERQMLAIIASGENPYDFGGINYVEKLESFYDGTQIDETTLLNDDFYGILALISAGIDKNSEIIQNTAIFIKDNQNGDGGWSYAPGADSDVDDTAAAIMALISAGENPSSTSITNALAYIKNQQADNGGFLSWGSVNSGTDSWAIDAIVAVGQDPTSTEWTKSGNTPVDDLVNYQNPDGSFNWTHDTLSAPEWMTSYAIPALVGKPYPVKIYEGSIPTTTTTTTIVSTTTTTTISTTTTIPAEELIVHLRIEGSDHTIWNEDMTVPESAEIYCYNSGETYTITGTSVLAALDNASELDGFDYTVSDAWYPAMGFYVDSIGGEEASGMYGWMYRVDYYSPSMSCDSFILDETNKEVLWYWGTFGEYPIKISVDKTKVNVSDTISIDVTYFNENDWLPLSEATVHADADYLTDENGTVEISIEKPGDYSIFAEKSGYIRSDKITVEVEGTQESAQVTLSATIIPAISFSVTPDSLDFGEIGVGYNKAGDGIYITNRGSWDINVTAEVEDNSTAGLYSAGLYLWGVIWNQFSTVVPHDTSDWEYTRGPYSTELKVPLNYTGVGPQNGTLILWAEGVSP